MEIHAFLFSNFHTTNNIYCEGNKSNNNKTDNDNNNNNNKNRRTEAMIQNEKSIDEINCEKS